MRPSPCDFDSGFSQVWGGGGGVGGGAEPWNHLKHHYISRCETFLTTNKEGRINFTTRKQKTDSVYITKSKNKKPNKQWVICRLLLFVKISTFLNGENETFPTGKKRTKTGAPNGGVSQKGIKLSAGWEKWYFHEAVATPTKRNFRTYVCILSLLAGKRRLDLAGKRECGTDKTLPATMEIALKGFFVVYFMAKPFPDEF